MWSQGCREAGEWWLLESRQEVLGRVVVNCRGEREGQRREYGSQVYYQKLVLSVFFPGRGKTTNSSQL